MSTYVDASALYALLDQSDDRHLLARVIWQSLLHEGGSLTTTSYVLLEIFALIQRRFGMAAVKDVQDSLVPVLAVTWVDEALHQAGLAAMLTANRRSLSLVDCVSFEICRQLGIREVFAFDPHFAEQGFKLLSADAEGS